MSKEIYIFAGEVSADLHGEKLIRALLRLDPTLKFFGVGGPNMRSTGMECILPMEAFQVMGFVDVLMVLPKLMKHFYFLQNAILTKKPAAAIFIDYAEFNMKMEKRLRKKNFSGKLIHFISPSVWAWRKKRADTMAKSLDLLLSILPFEPDYFAHTRLPVKFVGHPLITRLKEHPYKDNLSPKDKIVLALFPGSRTKEIKRNFSLMLRAAKHLQKPDLIIAVSLAHRRFKSLLEEIAKQEGMENLVFIEPENNYDLMRSASFAIAKSGTVTLELALHEVPTIVIYGVTKLDTFLAKHILHIILPYYCLVNIILNREVFPELIGPALTEEALFNKLNALVNDPEALAKCRQDCATLRQLLTDQDASLEAAKEIIKLLN